MGEEFSHKVVIKRMQQPLRAEVVLPKLPVSEEKVTKDVIINLLETDDDSINVCTLKEYLWKMYQENQTLRATFKAHQLVHNDSQDSISVASGSDGHADFSKLRKLAANFEKRELLLKEKIKQLEANLNQIS